MTGRTLVAGVGNIFLRDDAFGVEVVRLLAGRPSQAGVEIKDFGIRAVHLVYELLNGCDLFVLIDAAARGHEPGTVTILEVDGADRLALGLMDAHGLTPDDIFAMLTSMGGRPGRSLVVACEPADVSAGIGLSAQVEAALPHAVRAVEEILTARFKGRRSAGDDDQAYQGGDRSDGPRRGDQVAAGYQEIPGNQGDVARHA